MRIRYVFFLISFAWLDILSARGEHLIGLLGCPASWTAGNRCEKVVVRGRSLEAAGTPAPREVPEEDGPILPGRPQGSHHLPWDNGSIPRNGHARQGPAAGMAGLPAQGMRDGGIGPASGTNGTVEPPSVCGWCIAGRPRSGNENAGPAPEGRQKHAEAERATAEAGARRRSPPPSEEGSVHWTRHLRTDAWSRSEPPFRTCCATARAVMSRRASLTGYRPGIAAMPVASHASGAGPRTQVVGPQHESRPAETPPGVCGRGEEASSSPADPAARGCGTGPRPCRQAAHNCGRRL